MSSPLQPCEPDNLLFEPQRDHPPPQNQPQHAESGTAETTRPLIDAVVVLHGVGHTKPGATLETFVKAVARLKNLEIEEPAHVRLLPDEQAARLPDRNDLVPPPTSDTSLADRFPMHHRWTTIKNPAPGAPTRAVFAEVYWADLSRTQRTWWFLVLRFLTVIFHLRFIADRAADTQPKPMAEMPRSPDPFGRPQQTPINSPLPAVISANFLRWIIFWACWIVCGPVAAIYAVLLYLLLINNWLFKRLNLADPHLKEQVLGLSCVGLAVIAGATIVNAQRRRWGSPWPLTMGWIIGWSLLVYFLSVFGTVSSTPAEPINHQWLFDRLHLPNPADPFLNHFFILRHVMRLVLVGLCGVVLISYFAWLWALGHYFFIEKQNRWPPMISVTLALAAMLLQTGLWIAFVPALGFIAYSMFYPEMIDIEKNVFSDTHVAYAVHILFAAVIILAVILVWVSRKAVVAFSSHKPQNHRYKDEVPVVPRLIVNRWVVALVILLAPFGTVGYAWHVFTGHYPRYPLVDSFVRPYADEIMRFVHIAIIILGLGFQRGLGAALHVLLDVMYHFYERDFRFPPLGRARPMTLENFVVEMHIEYRMRRVLQEVLQNLGRVRRITIVSHSQGTVIAFNTLWLDWSFNLVRRFCQEQKVNLVTMGSPFTHLYQHYFFARYAPLFLENGQPNHKYWGDKFPQTIGPWINVYRIDDFVGTHIDGDPTNPDFPKNIPLQAGGHIHYFGQPEVIRQFQHLLPG